MSAMTSFNYELPKTLVKLQSAFQIYSTALNIINWLQLPDLHQSWWVEIF